MTVHEAFEAFQEADRQWSLSLTLAFGKQAGDKRYTKEGHTHPMCADKYAAFERAGKQWRKLMISNGRTI